MYTVVSCLAYDNCDYKEQFIKQSLADTMLDKGLWDTCGMVPNMHAACQHGCQLQYSITSSGSCSNPCLSFGSRLTSSLVVLPGESSFLPVALLPNSCSSNIGLSYAKATILFGAGILCLEYLATCFYTTVNFRNLNFHTYLIRTHDIEGNYANRLPVFKLESSAMSTRIMLRPCPDLIQTRCRLIGATRPSSLRSMTRSLPFSAPIVHAKSLIPSCNKIHKESSSKVNRLKCLSSYQDGKDDEALMNNVVSVSILVLWLCLGSELMIYRDLYRTAACPYVIEIFWM